MTEHGHPGPAGNDPQTPPAGQGPAQGPMQGPTQPPAENVQQQPMPHQAPWPPPPQQQQQPFPHQATGPVYGVPPHPGGLPPAGPATRPERSS